jgi:hypothetical protein
MFVRAVFRSPLVVLGCVFLSLALAGACSSNKSTGSFSGGSTQSGGNSGAGAANGNGGSVTFNTGGSIAGGSDAAPCGISCSPDHQSVVDCNGKTVVACTAGQGCDLTTGGCTDACTAAADNKQSVGCDYYATHLEMNYGNQQCFAAFVANTWNTPAHLTVEFYPGTPLSVELFGRIPSGAGSNITYTAYDPVGGLPPGEVAILFLSGSSTTVNVPCPAGVTTAAAQGSAVIGTGVTQSFHITSDVPVVSYQINPYGGGSAAITGASLLLPTSVWDTNYIAVTAAPYDQTNATPPVPIGSPSFNIVAYQDGTQVTLLPSVAIAGGGTLPAGPANMPYTFTLTQGQQAQFSQQSDLSGTIVQSTKPVGFMAGNACMDVPLGSGYCDHGEQMLPPVKSLGNEYVGVMFRPRVSGDQATWHLVGTVAGTELTYSSPVGGPATLGAGQAVDFITDQPFVVTSQDTAHPFMLFTYMSGSQWSMLSETTGYGDPDFVLSVPPQQYLNDYVFFTDVTYPETNLVVVRAKDSVTGAFDDVTLDCAGVLTGWQSVGNYEWTRIDLMRHDFVPQGNCSTGPHEMKSPGLFGLWVWGWGSPETTEITTNVSYGYPGGMNVQPLNGVVILPVAQ